MARRAASCSTSRRRARSWRAHAPPRRRIALDAHGCRALVRHHAFGRAHAPHGGRDALGTSPPPMGSVSYFDRYGIWRSPGGAKPPARSHRDHRATRKRLLLRCISPQLAVRPEGANHQWRRVPPG